MEDVHADNTEYALSRMLSQWGSAGLCAGLASFAACRVVSVILVRVVQATPRTAIRSIAGLHEAGPHAPVIARAL